MNKHQIEIWALDPLSVLLAYFINDRVAEFFSWDLSETFINRVFMMNILGVCSLVFVIQHYFVGRRTKLKEAIEAQNLQLQQQSELLKELDETKSRFFANISHEFRTPLTLILGLLEKRIGNSEADDDDDTMKRNADRLLQLINQLLDLSKLESGKMELQTTRADIVEFSRQTCMIFESAAEDKGIRFRFNGMALSQSGGTLPIPSIFDLEQMQKVLTNLLSNALKFTPKNDEIDISVDSNQDTVSISITNTGETIPEEKLPHFDRFYQVDQTSTREYEGTGIGLALVKELVELHGGTVQAKSANGLTTFSIFLPGATNQLIIRDLTNDTRVPEEAPAEKITVPISDEFNGAELEILIVEDYADLRKFIKQGLDGSYR